VQSTDFDLFDKTAVGTLIKERRQASRYTPIMTVKNLQKNSKKGSARSFLKQASLIAALLALASGTAFARQLSYDRYAPAYKKPLGTSSMIREIGANLLTYPLEPVRALTSAALTGIEKHHLDDKFMWAYDTLKGRGISPKLGFISLGSRRVGADVDFVKLAGLKASFPDLTVQGSVHYASDLFFNTGAQIGLERVGDTGLYAKMDFQYKDRPREHFYGIGPTTSAGDGAVYGYEETAVGPVFGYYLGDDLSLDMKVQYRNINISRGKEAGRLQARDLVNPGQLSGSYGDQLLTQEIGLKHDTRNHKGNSDRGGLRSLVVSYNEGLHESNARYLKYQGELSHYFKVFSDRQVVALRFYGEHNSELGRGEVPFHQLAKLGGYGRQNYFSNTLRGYDYNRFTDASAALFNLEYRYNIWHYRDFKLDAVAFWDEGQVFNQFNDLKLDHFRYTMGGGFRVSIAELTVLTLEAARAGEGTNVYIRTETPF